MYIIVVILLVLTVIFFILRSTQHTSFQRLFARQPLSRRKKIALIPVAILLFGGLAFFAYNQFSNVENKKTKPLDISQYLDKPKIPATKDLPAYEIVAEIDKFGTKRIEVYVLDKDKTLLNSLANKISRDRANVKPLFIDFYDNRKVAQSYFDIVSNKQIDLKDKRNASLHYLAFYTMSKDGKANFQLVLPSKKSSGKT